MLGALPVALPSGSSRPPRWSWALARRTTSRYPPDARPWSRRSAGAAPSSGPWEVAATSAFRNLFDYTHAMGRVPGLRARRRGRASRRRCRRCRAAGRPGRDWLLVLQWADLRRRPQTRPGTSGALRRAGSSTSGVTLAPTGWPTSAIHELAIARGPASTRSTVADVLDLRHRLPLVWGESCGLGCGRGWRLKVARASRSLDRHRWRWSTPRSPLRSGAWPWTGDRAGEAKGDRGPTPPPAARFAEPGPPPWRVGRGTGPTPRPASGPARWSPGSGPRRVTW